MVSMDLERFGSELTATLADFLRSGEIDKALPRALSWCAAAAEAYSGQRPVACGSGCPHCCVLNVAVLWPEALQIADWLLSQMAVAALATTKERLARHRSWVRWMDDEERIIRREFCPLLDNNGNCSIHPLRPLTCRGVASLDRDSCRAAFDPIICERERTVPVDLRRRAAYDAAFTAMGTALRRQGLDDRSIDLGCGILAFVENPQLRTMFLSGAKLPATLWGQD